MLNWTIEEPFGRDWAAEVVWRDVPGLADMAQPLSILIDDTCHRPAQVDGNRLAFVTDLPAGTQRRYELLPVAGETKAQTTALGEPLLVIDTDTATISAPGGAGVRLAWTGAPPSASLLALRRTDGTWGEVTADWPGADVLSRQEHVLAHGPVLVRLQQIFALAEGATVALTWEVDAVSPAVRVGIDVHGQVNGELVLHLGSVCTPQQAYWRPHSPSPSRGGTGSHKRQIYDVPVNDRVALGPFYNWASDAAAFWTCWGPHSPDLLYAGWVRPSQTRLEGPLKRLQLHVQQDQGLIDVRIPLQGGRRRLVFAVLDRQQLRLATDGPAGDLDTLHARWNGPGLDDLQRMDLQAAVHGTTGFPRLLLRAEDVAAVRRRLRDWPWLREQLAVHADDVILDSQARPGLDLSGTPRLLGQDAAGVFLATGDEARALTAVQRLAAELDELVDLLLDYGPSVDDALGISLARRCRALLGQLDLILAASSVSDSQRAHVLVQFAFVTEVQWLADAWPATDTGIERGNENFHADVVSARGMCAAWLDGHPQQGQWLATSVAEMAAFLEGYHTSSGACHESATYQLVSLGYALQLHAAAVRHGQDGLGQLPVLRRAFEFLAATQTPPDVRCGYRMLPTLGHVTVYAWCQSLQACFAWAAQATAGTDFSRRMMRAWRRGGGHVVSLHDYQQNTIWAPPLLLLDRQLPEAAEDDDLARSRVFEGLGAVLRAQHEDGSEGFLLAKMGPCHGHFDQDEGSFLWYAWGQPVLADFGTQYDPNFHAHPWLHNRISFDHKADAAPRQGCLLAQQLGEGVDYLCGEVQVTHQFFHGEWPDRDPEYDFRQAGDPWPLATPQRWRRHLLYIHDLEAVILLEEIDGDLPTDWNLQVHADEVCTTGNSATFTGRFDVDLDVQLLRPAQPNLTTSGFSHLGFDEPRGAKGWWRSARWTAGPGTSMTNMAEQALTLRAQADAGSPYFAALVARRATSAPTRFEAAGDWGVRIIGDAGEALVTTSAPFSRWDVAVTTPAGCRVTQIQNGAAPT
jgi:hypothetical protein